MNKIIFVKFDFMYKPQKNRMMSKIANLTHKIKKGKTIQEKIKKKNRREAMQKRSIRKYYRKLKLDHSEVNQS